MGCATLAGVRRPLIILLPQLRLPGLGLYYGDDPTGIPPVLRHFMQNIEAVHDANFFVTVRRHCLQNLT